MEEKNQELSLRVNEIFGPTIQGEGKTLNTPVIFIRLSGCNLACHWCFVGNTLVATPQGSKHIRELKVDDAVYGFNFKTHQVEKTSITKVFCREVSQKEMLSLKIGNRQLFCTRNHEFYVKDRGFVSANDLQVGDIVFELPDSLYASLRMREQNPLHNPKTVKKVAAKSREDFKTGFRKPYKRTQEQNRWLSDYRKIHNPMHNPEVARKNAQNHFKGPSSLEIKYEKAFRELPIYYVGNNKVPIGNKKFGYRFPDFIVKGTKKVIEIYDTTFKYGKGYRTTKWKNDRRRFFQRFGYEVEFLTEKTLQSWPKTIIPFLYNGKTVLEKKPLSNKGAARLDYPVRKAQTDPITVYNIETGTHNYYANMCLVHNCDTPYTWNWVGTSYVHPDKFDPKKEMKVMTVTDVIKEVVELSSDVNRVVISGGEPFLQQPALSYLIPKLNTLGYTVEIETNGTIEPTDEFLSMVDQINCSPKLENSGPDNPVARRVKPKALTKLAGSKKVYFKFVITSDKDLKEIQAMINTFGMKPEQIYLMPEGKTREEQLAHQKQVYDLCLMHGYNFSPRLHILLHDTKRGV